MQTRVPLLPPRSKPLLNEKTFRKFVKETQELLDAHSEYKNLFDKRYDHPDILQTTFHFKSGTSAEKMKDARRFVRQHLYSYLEKTAKTKYEIMDLGPGMKMGKFAKRGVEIGYDWGKNAHVRVRLLQ